MSPDRREKTGEKTTRQARIRRRCVLLAVTAAVLLGLAVWLKLWIREPEVPLPSAQPTDEAGGVVPVSGRRDGVYTFLLLGRDTGGGGNTDTMIVAAYDTVNQTVDMLNLYRDTMVNAPWDIKRINSVYNYGGGGEKGIQLLKEYLLDLLGFSPDYYVTVEWDAVGELVDAIGGVEFDVPYEMHYWDPTQNLRIDQAKGVRLLDGEDAMQVIRWRKNNDGSGVSVGDVGRVEIQQDFLKAVLRQCLSTVNLSTVPRYAQILLDNVTTDLPLGSVVWLGQRALGMDMEDLRFHSLPGNLNGAAWSRTVGNYQSYVLPDGQALVELVNRYFNPYTEEITLSELDIMSVNRDGSLSSSRGVVKDTPAASPPVKPSPSPEPTQETEDPAEPEPTEPAEPLEPGEEGPTGTGEGDSPESPAPEMPSEAPSDEAPEEPEEPEEPGGEESSGQPGEEELPLLPALPTPVVN